MMKQNINKDDEILKELLSGTKLKASDNLKYRIMQQVETETALSRKKAKSNGGESVLGNLLSVYGVVYALLFIIGGAFYFLYGKDSLLSSSFLSLAILIITVGSAFLAITFIDNRRQMHRKE